MSNLSQLIRLGALAVLVLLTISSVSAQSGVTGTIRGTVTDETGAVLPGVELTITNTETGQTRDVLSNDVGLYRASNLTPGAYEVHAEMAGFRAFTGTGINVTVGAEITVAITLQVGTVTEEITVTGAGQLVNTTSATMQALVDEVAVRELPLNGRDYLALATLQPGIIENRGQRQTRISPQTGTGLNLSISGGRPNSNVFRMDGIVINDHANSSPGSIGGANLGVDAIREFSALTNTYSAEYGRSSGGVINAVLRSGTNDIHGSAFFFHRNKALDARNFFNPEDQPPPFRRHQYGTTLGGPIAQDRTFLFGSYEKLTEFRGQESDVTVPTAAAKSGQLISGPVAVSPTMQPLINLYPDPTPGSFNPLTDNAGVFFGSPGRSVDAEFFTLRGDHQFNDKAFMHASYLIEDASIDSQDAMQLNDRFDTSRRQFLATELTYLVSPTIITSTRFGYNRSNMVTGDSAARVPELAAGTLDPGLSFIAGRPAGFVVIDSDGLDDFRGGDFADDIDAYLFESIQFYQDVSITQGKHDTKFGFNLEIIRDRGQATNNENGELTFPTLSDWLTDGDISRFRGQGADSDTTRHFRQQLWGAYAQDRIQVKSNFSLDLGLRWEMVTNPGERDSKESKQINFSDETLVTGDTYYTTPKINLSPRIGFAYDVFGDGKTALRGGFGVFHEMQLVNNLTIPALRMPPFFLRFDFTETDCPAITNSGFPGGPAIEAQNCLAAAQAAKGNPLAGLSSDPIQTDPSSAYRMQYNLNIQQEIANNTVLSIGYVGGSAKHLILPDPDRNLATGFADQGRLFFPHGGTGSIANALANTDDGTAAQVRRNPFWTRLGLRSFGATAHYNALQMAINRRFTDGLRLQGSYTWSKSIDQSSSTFTENQYQNGQGTPYGTIPKLNQGPSDFDVRHALVINGTYDIPMDLEGAAGTFLNGWQIGGIGQFLAGETMLVRHAGDFANTLTARNSSTSGVQRPDLIPGRDKAANPTGADKTIQFDGSAFELPGASLVPVGICANDGGSESDTSRCSENGSPGIRGVLGNVGRGLMDSSGYNSIDLVLTKNTIIPSISEDFNVQFRVEFFNAFNRTTFDVPSQGNMTLFNEAGEPNSNVGRSTRTFTNSREIQLGLKIIF